MTVEPKTALWCWGRWNRNKWVSNKSLNFILKNEFALKQVKIDICSLSRGELSRQMVQNLSTQTQSLKLSLICINQSIIHVIHQTAPKSVKFPICSQSLLWTKSSDQIVYHSAPKRADEKIILSHPIKRRVKPKTCLSSATLSVKKNTSNSKIFSEKNRSSPK